jgi:hypothetical protein
MIPGNAFIDLCAEHGANWTPDPAVVEQKAAELAATRLVKSNRDLRRSGFKRPGRKGFIR